MTTYRHRLVVLGGGTAGTMVANRLRRRLPPSWKVTVVDRDDEHLYQPGLLRVPFGEQDPARLVRSRRAQLLDGVELVLAEVDRVIPVEDAVLLKDGRCLAYDDLVIATGTSPAPGEVPGTLGPWWRTGVFDFYTLDGAVALRRALERFEHGRLVVHVSEMPIKCPVAPLEFVFLADAWLRDHGRRDQVELVYATPLSEAFTQPIAARRLGHLLQKRGITLETDFMVERIDEATPTLVSYDGREIPFDLLVTVPVNKGADFVARSGLGDELNYVHVDRRTFRSPEWSHIFAIGDANDIPTSKAGSVAHFSVDVFVDNFLQYVAGEPMTHAFDGHANCFVETGHGKALLIDFNYDVQPLPGKFPVPVLGPMTLLGETRLNHAGKAAFPWVYWHALLPGRPLPLRPALSMAGKHREEG